MSPKFIREGFDLCQCARDLVLREAVIIFLFTDFYVGH